MQNTTTSIDISYILNSNNWSCKYEGQHEQGASFKVSGYQLQWQEVASRKKTVHAHVIPVYMVYNHVILVYNHVIRIAIDFS